VTEAMNSTLALIGDEQDSFVSSAANTILERTEW